MFSFDLESYMHVYKAKKMAYTGWYHSAITYDHKTWPNAHQVLFNHRDNSLIGITFGITPPSTKKHKQERFFKFELNYVTHEDERLG